MSTSSKLIEIAAELKHETERAYLLYDGTCEVWVPKTAVENNGDGTFTMPEKLALDKGLI